MKTLHTLRRMVADRRTGNEAVEYRWAVTLTRRSTDEADTVFESYKVARTPDELCNIVLHSSLDPTVVAYNYYRYVQPERAGTAEACGCCAESFHTTPPWQRWQSRIDGGGVVIVCRACGADQVITTGSVDPDP